jgi:glutamate carboxypeptidase
MSPDFNDQKKSVDYSDTFFDFSELATIVNTNSYTKNKVGVDNVGRLYQKIFENLSFTTTRYSRDKIGDHLLFSSQKTGRPKLLLLGHIDTVFPPGAFESFSEDENSIYGPGVCDMKGGIHIAISALREVNKCDGYIADIDMLLVSDEESGSDDSKMLSAQLANNYNACLVFEAAGINDEVVVARKGVGTFIIDIQGKAAHAGNNYLLGANANLAAAHMIVDLTALTNTDEGSTVNVGKISGGIGANTISPNSKIILDVRFTKESERDRVLGEIKRIVDHSYVNKVTASLSGGIQRDVMQSDEKQSALLRKLETIIGESLITEQRGGGSDANIISAAGVATLDGFGPFGHGDHTIDEQASKKSFARRVSQMSKILLAYNGIKP